MNSTIIMGRKTFESLPNLLPNRQHIVITTNQSFSASGVIIRHNLTETLSEYKASAEEVFVIGGGAIYKEALVFCDKLYLTRIHKSFDADVFFPEINLSEFSLVKKSDMNFEMGVGFTFEIYSRDCII